MTVERSFSLVALVLMGFTLGCGPAQQATVSPTPKPAADQPVAREDAFRPAIDPRVLPDPRPPLAGTPDLSNAQFTITDATLKAMTEDGLPAAAAASLGPLKDRGFRNVVEFRAAVEDKIGKSAAEQHMPAILRHALLVTLADVPELPEGKVDLQAAETGPRVQSEATPAVLLGSMGSERFKPVFFDFDKSQIKPEFKDAIAHNVKELLGDKALKVVIEGHCDERGSTEYNLALGERRAEAVRKALVAAGLPVQRLKAVSYGEERPADPGHDETAWSKNRRAVINLQ